MHSRMVDTEWGVGSRPVTDKTGFSALSTRELEIAEAYADGESYKEIARNLTIAPATVRTHLSTVYRKLGVASKTELTQALKDGSASEQVRDSAELVAELALELDEAYRRERVLANVLRIISQQGNRPDAVLDAALDHALEICEAEFGILFEYQGNLSFRAMRTRNIAPAFGRWLREQELFQVDADTGLGRLASELKTISITDVRGEDVYRNKAALRVATADLGKARSFVAIPMMSGEKLLGAFTIYRTRVHPFNDRTLELAQLFADQIAIAIEYARKHQELTSQPASKTSSPKESSSAPPVLAILPFRAVDENDAHLANIGRGLASSIIMELSASPLFRVIDQASSFSDSLSGFSAIEAASRLGARHVVSGSIRRLRGGGFRIAVALHVSDRSTPIWTDRLETTDSEFSDLTDDLLTRLCSAIGAGIERELVETARARRPRNQTALDHFLQGLDLHHQHTIDGFTEARTHFIEALVQDPSFARAEAALAITFVREWFWESTRQDLLDVAAGHARTAMGLAPHDPWAQTVWGVVALYQRRHAEAEASFERAMELAPHDAYVVSRVALGKLYAGDFETSVKLFRQSILLDPLHAERQRGMLGHALFHLDRYEEALGELETIKAPLFWETAWRACCYAMLGETDRATAMRETFRNSADLPSYGYDIAFRPFKNETDRERLAVAMQRAGLPDPKTDSDRAKQRASDVPTP